MSQAGQHRRTRTVERAVGSDQRLFGLEQVGPAAEQVGGQAIWNGGAGQPVDRQTPRDRAPRTPAEDAQRILLPRHRQLRGGDQLLGGARFPPPLPQFEMGGIARLGPPPCDAQGIRPRRQRFLGDMQPMVERAERDIAARHPARECQPDGITRRLGRQQLRAGGA